MKLQVAIDLADTKEMLRLAEKICHIADIIEIGTPMIMKEGMVPVYEARKHFPNTLILSDTKIVDGGSLEAAYACEAGADIVTVLAAADDATIQGVIDKTHAYGRKTLVDLINIRDVVSRAQEIDRMGADYICVHTASDVQATGRNPLEELRKIKAVVKNAHLAAAGGINEETIADIMQAGADIVIIGSAITQKEDPVKEAERYKRYIKAGDKNVQRN